MPYAQVPGFLAKLRERESIASLALEFTILTAARTGEVIGARWDEIEVGRPKTTNLSQKGHVEIVRRPEQLGDPGSLKMRLSS